MKFSCDKCNTRYSIADERVRGRVLKIRCKACNNVITVREDEAAAPVADSLQGALEQFSGNDEQTRVSTAPPPPVEGGASDEWYVSFDGEQEGPLPLSRALDRVKAERPRGKECYCWRGGFFVWLPVEDVPEFAPALASVKAAPPPIPPTRPSGAHAAVKSPTGPQAALKSPTGSQAAVGRTTGSQAAVKSPTGPQPALKSPTGSQAAVGRTTGSQAAVGRTTGSQAAVKATTGAQPALKSPTGSQPAIGKTTGSHPKVSPKPAPHSKPLALDPASAFDTDLPPLDSGPMALPEAPMPSLPTKPEPRLARKQEEAASPFAAALKSAGGPALPDSAAHSTAPATAAAKSEAAAPRSEAARVDSQPVPLPPPPVNDLPIGEASGLFNLSHLAKPSMAQPTVKAHGKPVDTFGGVPVTPAALPTPAPQPVVLVGPRGAAPWMKWAAAAGALATVALGIVVVVLMSRKPTVIVVPPAPNLDEAKKVDDKPITIADGPVPTAQGAPDPKRPSHRQASAARASSAPKPPSDANLSAAQRKLASLYRDDSEHGVPSNSPALERARNASAGSVSQQAIMAVVTQNRRSLNLCYDRVLKHDSSLKSGRVLTHVKVGISGSVTGVSVPDPQYANSEIGQCISQTIKHWHFPSADAEYETEFPIILQAN